MFLDTTNSEKIYEAVAAAFSTEIETIREYIMENAEEIVDNNYDEHSITSMSLCRLKDICRCTKLNKIKSLIVNHITPREKYKKIWTEGLSTLPHALINKTVLSEYLAGLGFTFEFIDDYICMKKDNEEVDVKKLQFSNLLMRLGGKGTFNDYNINGYLFVDKFEVHNCRGWLGSPEFLKSLATAYADKSIANKYADRCNNYLVSFRVPLGKIDLEGFDADIGEDFKSELLIKYCINRLAFATVGKLAVLEMYNPIIFLKRDYDVPAEDIEKIYHLEHSNGILTPKELSRI